MAENQVGKLDEKFQRMETLIESFMNTVYQWDTIDPLEVALFLQVLAGKQLDTALEIHMDLHKDQVEAIARKQVDIYNDHNMVDRDTFIGEVIGLHSVLGTRLMKLHMLINDIKNVNRDIITAADLDDGGPM
ncbi:hypothetical protein D3C76_865120 [compost metagenome]